MTSTADAATIATLMKAKLIVAVALVAIAAGAGFGNASVTPTTFLLDERGRIVRQYLGEPDWAEFHALVERALSEPA